MLVKSSGVETLHKLGYTGAGVKVLVVGSDFTGADKLIGNGLPKKTRILDLTTELNPEIVPVAGRSEPRRATGLAAARAVALAAPDAELVLVRIDPGAIFQLVRHPPGRATATWHTPRPSGRASRTSRLKTTEITRRKEAAITEYRNAFADLADDEPTKARREPGQGGARRDRARSRPCSSSASTGSTTFRQGAARRTDGRPGHREHTRVGERYPLDSLSLLSSVLEQSRCRSTPAVMLAGPAIPPRGRSRRSSGCRPRATPGRRCGADVPGRERNGTMEFATPNAAASAREAGRPR